MRRRLLLFVLPMLVISLNAPAARAGDSALDVLQARYEAAKADLLAGRYQAALAACVEVLAQGDLEQQQRWRFDLLAAVAHERLDRPLTALASYHRFLNGLATYPAGLSMGIFAETIEINGIQFPSYRQ